MSTQAASSSILPHNSTANSGQPLPNQSVAPQIPQTLQSAHQPQYYAATEAAFVTPVNIIQSPYSMPIHLHVDPNGLRRSMGQDPMDTNSNRVIPVVQPIRDQALFNSYPHTNHSHPLITYPQQQQQYYSESYQLRPHASQMQVQVVFPSKQDNPVSWMSDASLPLKEMRILGTHNSGFFMGEQRSQRLDVSEQLKCGVRFLDLALVQYYDEIYLDQYKPMFELGCPYITLSEVLWCVRLFLEQNENEIIFINLRTNESIANIDEVLLELKFEVINKFIFDINEINLEVNPTELISEKHKNIILFSTTEQCFKFLWTKNLTLGINQIEEFRIYEDLTNSLKKFWSRPKNNFSSKSRPQDLRFSRFLIDSAGYEADAEELSSVWNSFLISGAAPRFFFFTLCKVNSETWKKFSALMQAYYTY